MNARILFVLKNRLEYWGDYTEAQPSSGLRNSTIFVADMLNSIGIGADVVDVVDGNDIDRIVTARRPTHVFIDAIWVVPTKFDELIPLHPNVHWIVRNHSEIPFLAGEGMAIEWIAGYLRRGIEVNNNSKRSAADLRAVARTFGANTDLVTYLPNYYPSPDEELAIHHRQHPRHLHLQIGCFGAIRPLKNQLQQAVAAVTFADELGVRLSFHINDTRVEGHGAAVLSNLRALFANSVRHRVVEHDWCAHEDFLDVLQRMDVAMQVSFSETFNIVSADAVAVGVPVIASPEVSWLGPYAMASPTDCHSIIRALWRWNNDLIERRLRKQARDLMRFSAMSRAAWAERFGEVG